tara:strand:+ start:1314 stop:4043 length:2730 start_codon:yes stop_codon:yes gene_type:complete
MALPDLTGQNIQDTYQRVVQKDTDGQLLDGTGSAIPIKIEGNNIRISGSLIAEQYIVSSSVTNITTQQISGSTQFGDSIDDTHTFTGHITASGNISSSGNLILSQSIEFNADNTKLNFNNTGGGQDRFIAAGPNFMNIDADANLNLYADTRVYVNTPSFGIGTTTLNEAVLMVDGDIKTEGANGHITASGNISSSGFIQSKAFIFDDDNGATSKFIVTPKGQNTDTDNILLGGNVRISQKEAASAAGFSIAGSDVSSLSVAGLISGSDFRGLTYAFSNVAAVGANIEKPYFFYSTADNFINVGGSAQEGTYQTRGIRFVTTGSASQNRGVRFNAEGSIIADSHITASGNIWASGSQQLPSSVIANSGSFNVLSGDTTHATGLQVNGFIETIGTSGNITASNDISASGEIYGKGFHAPNNINDGYHIGGGKPILSINGEGGYLSLGAGHDTYQAAGVNIYTTGSDTNAGLFLDSVGNITSSGNISASGAIYAGHIYFTNNQRSLYNTSGVLNVGDGVGKVTVPQLKVNTHITASGNISSSGDILGVNSKFIGTGSFDKGIAIVDPGFGGFNIGADLHRGWLIDNQEAYILKFAQADGTDTTFALNSQTKKATFYGDISASGNITVNNITVNEITASGNISSSGVITAEGLSISDDAIVTDNFAVGGNTLFGSIVDLAAASTVRVEGDIHATSHITSSGEISSSGKITGYQLSVNGVTEVSQNGRIYPNYGASTNNFIGATASSIKINGGSLEVAGTGHITASGNISASGNYIGNRQFDISNTANNNTTQGDIIYYGNEGTIEAGDIVYLKGDGAWNVTDANVVARATRLHGIALGDDASVHGILLRGMYTLDHDLGNGQAGAPLYLSGTAGELTATAPSTSGDVVRVMGYQLDDDDQIWFSPDNTWVEIA